MPTTPPDPEAVPEPADQPMPADETADTGDPKPRTGDAQAAANRAADPPA